MKRGFLNGSKVKKEPLYPGSETSSGAAPPSSTNDSGAKGKGKEKEKEKPAPAFTKLAYGKVDKIGLPENYESPEYTLLETDPSKTDHPSDLLLMTTIPPRTYEGPDDPDGHSEWIVIGPTKAKVLNHPQYPKPVPKPIPAEGADGPAFEIRDTPDTAMSKGLFALRDIKVGQLIFAERPLLVSPRNIGLLGATYIPEGRSRDMNTIQAVAMYEWEKQLEVAVGRMSKENQKAFKELENNHKEDGSGPLLGIVRTNGFSIEEIYDGEERTDVNSYGAILKLGSRINHSCLPNVTYNFLVPSFSFQFFAQLDIKAGEQLFFSYCEIEQSKAERDAELAPYGIICSCPVCAHATPETDALRKEFKKRTRQYMVKIRQWISEYDSAAGAGAPEGAGSSKGRLNEDMLEPILKFREGLLGEGLKYTKEYKAIAWNLHLFYEKIGVYSKSKTFLEEYSEIEEATMRGASSL
ncbi:hypothetical protein CPB84DRAFT_1787544 [Gymnopilus junonius]|uniref:SET domain-containing protein n=1 Tax=Gymnopilus junonius TaxID=109634 RepID=A0A9P5NI08_GYMJU|nr:hypothetical protein CPB84DRAFT_1787544 [Gymnopilus junonius]